MIVRAHGEFAGLVGVISNRAGVCCRHIPQTPVLQPSSRILSTSTTHPSPVAYYPDQPMTLSGMKCSMIVRAHGEFAGLVGVISNRAGVCSLRHIPQTPVLQPSSRILSTSTTHPSPVAYYPDHCKGAR
jgi:hypothetical protein